MAFAETVIEYQHRFASFCLCVWLQFCLLFLTWLIFSPCCRSLILLQTSQLLYIPLSITLRTPVDGFQPRNICSLPRVFYSYLVRFKKQNIISQYLLLFLAYRHVYIVMWIRLFDWYQSIVVYCHVTLSYICNIVIFFSNKEKTIYIIKWLFQTFYKNFILKVNTRQYTHLRFNRQHIFKDCIRGWGRETINHSPLVVLFLTILF